MNQVHRVIWSHSAGGWVVVAETAHSQSQSGGRSVLLNSLTNKPSRISGLLSGGLAVLFCPTLALADSPTSVVPAGGNTNAYISDNGVPIVDIEKANGKGISHNRYTKYNVEAKGLVLNNGTSASISYESKLAGQVGANLNLDKSAQVILNEVVSNNRSTLEGFTEVVGTKADVIVANPYGITCDGCGFINTDRATLTTGTPVTAGDGSLTGFSVNQGAIHIGANGANASDQQIFDLVTRSLTVEGKINTAEDGSLGIVAGNNEWDYGSREITGSTSGTDAAPSYAIDSSVLGGMYSGSIRIIATESGVGVRMLGDAAASNGSFTITSSGKIEMKSAVSASENLTLVSTASTGSEDLHINGDGASLSAGANLSLTSSGEIKLTAGAIYADNDLNLQANTMTDASAGGTRFAGSDNTVVTNNATSIDGSTWGAGENLSVAAGSLTVEVEGATLYADREVYLNTTNDLSLAHAAVRSVDNLTLLSSSGSISVGAGSGQGVQSTAGDVVIAAEDRFSNAGVISSDTADLRVRAYGLIENTGTIYANAELSLADRNSGSTQNISNSGTLMAGRVVIEANELTNSGSLQSETSTGLVLVSSLSNTSDILSNGSITLRGMDSSYSVTNQGRIQSAELTDIKGLGGGKGVTISNSGDIVAGSLEMNADSLTLSGGTLSTAGVMTLDLTQLTSVSENDKIIGATLGTGLVDIDVANNLSYFGAIHSGDVLNIDAPSILTHNTTGISAARSLNLNANTSTFYNYGALYAGDDLLINAATDIRNYIDGSIDSSGDIDITAGATFTNNDQIKAFGDIDVTALSFNNEVSGGIPDRIWNYDVWYECTSNCENGWSLTEVRSPNIWGSKRYFYEKIGYREQYFSSALPETKPHMIAGGNMTIGGFTSAVNTGGLLAASSGEMVIIGSGSFIVDDLSLEREERYRTNIVFLDCNSLGCDDPYTTYHDPSTTSISTLSNSYNVGIYAETLSATGFSLTNLSGAWAANPSILSEDGVGSDSLSLFPGLSLTLPTNPNGYFLVSQDPDSGYVVETNSLFTDGSQFLGSSYMEEQYGYNPSEILKKLGDANYEAYLIQQQLINQTGTNRLDGYTGEVEQVQGLMDSGLTEGTNAGFIYGEALTEEQINNLESDIVWMVKTEVNGQTVLAPVVYLSNRTKNSILSGAVISASNIDMQLTSLTNTGGTISGSENINVTSESDIINTSGNVQGGNVSLQSAEGSIINETIVRGDGNDESYTTSIGNTAGITATRDLSLDAEEDINVIGADVTVGGDASLTAGGDITFDTIVDRTTETTRSSSSSNLLGSNSTTTTTTTETNIGSSLNVGGNLTTGSGNDTTIAGSAVSVSGDLDVETGGDLNVVSRQDSETVHSVTTESGAGVGGGVTGTETTTVNDFTGTNVGSSMSVGGNADLRSDSQITVQGSDVEIIGDANVEATDGIAVLDGVDERRTTTVVETTTFLKIDSDSESDSSSESSSEANNGTAYASAEASAEAEASVEGDADLKLMETSVSITEAGSNTSVASGLTVGGDLNMQTDGTLTVQGSDVESGGSMNIEGGDVEILTGRNEEWSNTATTTVSVGLFNEASAKAKAETKAETGVGAVGTDGSASAKSSAEAEGTATLGVQTVEETTASYSLTNRSAVLRSGTDMSVVADGDATFVGAEVEAGNNMNIEAARISNLAAQDIEESTSSKTTQTGGLYIDAKVETKAETATDAGKIKIGEGVASAKGEISAEANASAGLRFTTETEETAEGSITQQTTSFTSGGDFTRAAGEGIIDQGTQIEAGGNITQTAETITDIEAHDATWSSQSTTSHDAKIGVGATASAKATAEGNVSKGSKPESKTEKSAGAGLRAKYEGEISSESESTTSAVTTTYQSGGSISSTSTEATTLIGAQFEAVADITIEADSLDYQAAQDTATSSSSKNDIKAEIKVDVYGETGAEAKAEYVGEMEEVSSTTAQAGSINTGGNLTITTQQDVILEGTQISAGDSASIDAGGSVDFQAAADTETSSSSKIEAKAEVKATKSDDVGGKAEGGYGEKESASSTAQTGSIDAGGGGLTITAGNDVRLQGTDLSSEGDASIHAGGDVALEAATNTETSTAFEAKASVEGKKNSTGSKVGGSAGGSFSYSDKVESDTSSINAAGGVAISGNNVINQEANISGGGGAQIIGNEINVEAESKDISIQIEASVKGAGKDGTAPTPAP